MTDLPYPTELYVGVKVKRARVAGMLRELRPYLGTAEVPLALVTTTSVRPLLSHILVTNERVLAFHAGDVARVGWKVHTGRADVAGAEIRKSFAHVAALVVTLKNRLELGFGDVQPADASVLLERIGHAGSPSRQSRRRFNSPPGWPVPPAGWEPPAGWQPDPAWPAAPADWQFWIEAPQTPDLRDPGSGSAAVPSPDQLAPEPTLPAPAPADANPLPAPLPAPSVSGHGLFGGKKRIAELEAENAQLHEWIQQMRGMDAFQLRNETERLRAAVAELGQQAAEQNTALTQARAEIVDTQEIALLQEAGVYEYQHPLSDAVAYKGELERLKDKYKSMVRSDTAVLATTTWHVNNSLAEGRRMVRDISKLMLRAYNAEADNLVRTMRPYKLQASIDRLGKTVQTIARLGKTMSITISPAYHQARIAELRLTADYIAKVEEEKERVRAEREHQREEQKALKEFEREKARLLKERSHYLAALAKLEANADEVGAAEIRGKLSDVDQAITDMEGRQANTRAGYVYVISNIGAFGERMVKIGMTRRLEPMDRVRELGDASVPFRFDVHALIFSEDAVELENRLHHALADKRVNLVNLRREFFYATPTEVRTVVKEIAGQHLLEFHETPEAIEWRTSRNQRGAD
ncbi:DUF4041 domain-containing protein [Actinoallomurus sp. NBC_01490]|uniref:DUF4041 domain-containing protein n=1 Tax=Actinoallomurus sp. NBC_01490 TaxID=2903557 RepID=UPI002E35300E|nr:DUF4041 domain-containing protein [Actinoallomurus sp. NBC_01490]